MDASPMNAWAVLLALCIVLMPRGDEYMVIGVEPATPTPLHRAVQSMVEGCVGRAPTRQVVWARAELIVGPDGSRPYAVTMLTDDVAAIMIERRYWLHPGVISHEVVHAIVGIDSENSPEMRRCFMWVGTSLVRRPNVPPDSVAALQRRAGTPERIGSW